MRFAEIQEHLRSFRVGIAGAGGLGSNCAVALARTGVGTLVISDFDKVERENLNRQHYFTDQVGMMKTVALKENLARVNPDVFVIIYQKKLDRENIPEIFAGCDVVVEAFDRAEMKEMLIETVLQKMPGTVVVTASGLAGWGRSNDIRHRKIDDTLHVCGDEESETGDDMPPMAPRVGITASMQANVVTEILLNKKIKDLPGGNNSQQQA